MPENYVLLERTELNASAASVTFANIPQTGYTDLKIVVSARTDFAGNTANLYLRPNNLTTNLSQRELYGTGSTATSTTDAHLGLPVVGASATANTFGNYEVYIPNYTSSNNKSFSFDSVTENNATAVLTMLSAGLWSQTAAITSIVFTADGNLVAGSTFSLYGIAALGTTPAIAPKASGGNIIDFDGTYWIHTFLTSGTFTPQTGLTCDVLVVAGGGGGSAVIGGGGGAGGYLYHTSQSLTAINYGVAVGAGGSGSNGSNSQFGSITASVGGGAGARPGLAGGSGGGGGWNGGSGTNTGGAASPSGQGNAGGSSSSDNAGGGGGGASAAGQSISGASGGNGGAGLANSISGTSVTYAGGGGGGRRTSAGGSSGAGGAGGGGAGGSTGVGNNGTTNTGGGGGGATYSGDPSQNGGAGGSGIVIIRYPAA